MSGSLFSHLPQDVPKVDTPFRKIQTQIPVPESIPLLQRMYELESRSMHGQMPIIWDQAEGFQVHDKWGNKWIDFTSTIFVANAGHGNPKIVDALRAVLDKPILHSYSYASEERLAFLEYLIAKTPSQFEKAFLLSAGTESSEAVLKLMRLNGIQRSNDKNVVLCFEGNWHGRTLGAQMMSGKVSQKEWIGYHDPNIHHLPFPYPWSEEAQSEPRKFFRNSIEKLLREKKISSFKNICGVMMETFQGWGAIFYPKEFVQEVQAFARENDALLAFDEMQSGFGRTGKLFGYMHYEVEPDLLCCGKGASSSLPLSIVLGSSQTMDLPEMGSMSSTHSANPMVCAAGKANLKAILEDGIMENSHNLGRLFHSTLEAIKKEFPNHLCFVHGRGLLAALIFRDKQGKSLASLCDRISELCLQRGLLVVHTGIESIKLAPPLVITKEGLIEGMEVLRSSVRDAISKK
jgi:4-aminobutyrate aminotransferase / (S)-3-amino-2-methylpropionate transaminase / 5-aminovalerate transaminase